eukprot:6210035-Pleurochrysis_carterae.AAC.1
MQLQTRSGTEKKEVAKAPSLSVECAVPSNELPNSHTSQALCIAASACMCEAIMEAVADDLSPSIVRRQR